MLVLNNAFCKLEVCIGIRILWGPKKSDENGHFFFMFIVCDAEPSKSMRKCIIHKRVQTLNIITRGVRRIGQNTFRSRLEKRHLYCKTTAPSD